MITPARWAAEIRKMNEAFPWFRPFDSDNKIGFRGELSGPANRLHLVTIAAWKRSYPALPPSICIEPRVGPNWCADGSLCIERRWQPASTFAQQVLFAIAYLDQLRNQQR
jgi:hypothetical protein